MQPEVVVNYVAVVVCTIVLIPVGYLWFGPIFGARWARHMGFEEMEPPSGGERAKKIGLHTLGSVLIAFVLVHSIAVWQPSAWGGGENQAAWIYRLNGAIWTWIGFFVPMQLTKVAWEDKGWGLVAGCDQRRLRPGAAPDFRDDPGLVDVEKGGGGLTELARPEPENHSAGSIWRTPPDTIRSLLQLRVGAAPARRSRGPAGAPGCRRR